jgi:hypothetical protein
MPMEIWILLYRGAYLGQDLPLPSWGSTGPENTEQTLRAYVTVEFFQNNPLHYRFS